MIAKIIPFDTVKLDELLKKVDWKNEITRRYCKFIDYYLKSNSLEETGKKFYFTKGQIESIFKRILKELEEKR